MIEKLCLTKLITKQELSEIEKLYNEAVPYHNFLHALKVAESILFLPHNLYTFIEVKSLFIAALFHDAGHSGTAENLDEFRSLDLAFSSIVTFEEKYDYTQINFSIIRQAIIGTVFQNRSKNINSYAILLADMDVATL